MKTKIFKPLLAMACLLSSINASAYDFEVDGIYYDVVSLSELTCEVVGGYNGFSGDVVIPAHVNYANKTLTVVGIADKLFNLLKCSELTGITIPNTITSISNWMFDGCKKLERVKIEDGDKVLELGLDIFDLCPIKSLYVGRNLLYDISDKYDLPFYGIKTLKEVTIGNSVTEIGHGAFYNCSGLTSIVIPNSVIKIGSSAFRGCSGLTSVTIPNSVIEIGAGAFDGCRGLTSITIPNSVTEIGNSAFYGCRGLTSITIGNSVTKIGSSAFDGCRGLTNITIPNSVTEIGWMAFCDCTALTALYILNTTPPTIEEECFETKQYMTLNVFVPHEALSTYQGAVGWKNFWNLQGFDPTGIDNVKNDILNGSSKCYDLRGNRLSAPKRGLNIINGKKVIVK